MEERERERERERAGGGSEGEIYIERGRKGKRERF